MIIYKLDRKHHFYTQYKSHLLGWKLQPLRNLWKQLYKNINIFIFTGCQTFIPWQLMSEKALQIIESMVADNKKYILWFKYCLISLVKSAYCDFSFFLHPVQVTVNETSKHQEAGLMWEIPSPTVFFCLFVLATVSGMGRECLSFYMSLEWSDLWKGKGSLYVYLQQIYSR